MFTNNWFYWLQKNLIDGPLNVFSNHILKILDHPLFDCSLRAPINWLLMLPVTPSSGSQMGERSLAFKGH